jgi:hypothetical protein
MERMKTTVKTSVMTTYFPEGFQPGICVTQVNVVLSYDKLLGEKRQGRNMNC